jgi:excisionase family DNA binding protein
MTDTADKPRVPERDRLAYRPREAARALGISERTLRTLTPRLPHLRIGGVLLYPRMDLERWLHEQARAQSDERRERVASLVREGLTAIGQKKSR